MMNNERVYNFSAGPSMLPLPVIEQAARELINYNGCGMSVMEMSHRSKEFAEIINTTEQDLRDLMNIPDNYKVLFLQGGASLQFSMIPINLFRKSGKADYVITGSWAKKAAKEAAKYGQVNILASSEESNFSYIPVLDSGSFTKDADYFFITQNNTIYGTRYASLPDTGNIPLVSDMSSMILSEKTDVKKYGLIFAGAQKNLGPAGLTLVIIREDLIETVGDKVPTMMSYKIHGDNDSLYNTPPCFTIYMAGLNFRWIKDMGGIEAIQQINEEKASLLYNAIDNSDLFRCPVNKKDRSLMNVVFVTGQEQLDKKFIYMAKEEGLVNLSGHRSVGGMRASIYNAMPIDGIRKLISFMQTFEREHKTL
jgi:phosphoserine aminotransferase